MERPRRPAHAAACGLALALSAAAGCKSTRPEVPPPPAFTPSADPNRPVGFGSDPAPATGNPFGVPGSNNVGSGGRANPYKALPVAPPAGGPPSGVVPPPTTDAGTPPSAVETLPPMESIRGDAKPADDGSQPRGTMGRGDSGPSPN